MKHKVIFTTLLLTLFSANIFCWMPSTQASAKVWPPQISSGGSTYTCPNLPVQIVQFDVTPNFPSPKYGVKASWTANAPSCFSIDRYKVKANLRFANGQTKSLEQSISGSQTSFQGVVSGAGGPPEMADVTVTAFASAPASGFDAVPAGIGVSTNCPKIPVHITQAVFNGLQPIPNRPGDYYPTVKVVWNVNGLASCIRVKEFKLKVTIASDGKQQERTVMLSGNQFSSVVVIESVAVGSSYTPQTVKARVDATGVARIEGTATKKIRIN